MYCCERCNANHEGSYGSGRFCSVICAHSRGDSVNFRQAMKARDWRIPQEARERGYEILRSNNLRKYQETDFVALSWHLKKRTVLIEQDRRCLHCGLNEWQGKPLVIEIDHIDGNNKNDARSNLRGLCPNCHSQTPTWKKRKSTVVAQLVEAIDSESIQ